MITFSMSAIASLSIVGSRPTQGSGPLRRGGGALRALDAPAPDRLAQLDVGDDAGDRRQPKRGAPVGHHGDRREAEADDEGGEGANHARVPPADAAGQRQQVAE